jgi:hypothetical protein
MSERNPDAEENGGSRGDQEREDQGVEYCVSHGVRFSSHA